MTQGLFDIGKLKMQQVAHCLDVSAVGSLADVEGDGEWELREGWDHI